MPVPQRQPNTNHNNGTIQPGCQQSSLSLSPHKQQDQALHSPTLMRLLLQSGLGGAMELVPTARTSMPLLGGTMWPRASLLLSWVPAWRSRHPHMWSWHPHGRHAGATLHHHACRSHNVLKKCRRTTNMLVTLLPASVLHGRLSHCILQTCEAIILAAHLQKEKTVIFLF